MTSKLSAALATLNEVSASKENISASLAAATEVNGSLVSQSQSVDSALQQSVPSSSASSLNRSETSISRNRSESDLLVRRNSSPAPPPFSRRRPERSKSIQVNVRRRTSTSSASSPVTAASYASCISSPATFYLSNIAQQTSSLRQEEYLQGDQVHHYTLDSEIGIGAFSKVYKAYNSNPEYPHTVAIKILRKPNSATEKHFKQVLNTLFHETQIWSKLEHPYILQMYQVMEGEDDVFVVSEIAQESLFKYLKEHGALSEDQAKRIFKQLASAIKYMHQMGFVHRDVKLENILLAREEFERTSDALVRQMSDFELDKLTDTIDKMQVKLADFGLSQEINSVPVYCAGTLHYCAPEEIKQMPTDLTSSDIWALGCVLYAMLTGKMAFDDDFLPRLQQSIINGQYDTHALSNLSEQAQNLLKGIFQVDMTKRLRIDDIQKHEWLSEA